MGMGRLRAPSPAFVISLVALFIALGGTSYAATKVILTRHKDAKADTKLVKKLAPSLSVKHAKTAGSAASAVNAANATHATSAANAIHAATASNVTGIAGPLASGQTLIGMWAVGGHRVSAGNVMENALSFSVPMGAAPTANWLDVGAAPTTNCPGTDVAPAAAPGQLCFYTTEDGGGSITGLSMRTTKWGARYFPTGVAADTDYEAEGTWAATG